MNASTVILSGSNEHYISCTNQNVSMGNYSQQEGQSGRTADEEQEKDGEFLIKQAKLQQEAKIALVQVRNVLHYS